MCQPSISSSEHSVSNLKHQKKHLSNNKTAKLGIFCAMGICLIRNQIEKKEQMLPASIPEFLTAVRTAIRPDPGMKSCLLTNVLDTEK